jgi:UDP-N-acetylglucosamine--N-acetylmuramyl-(pentapeptide) pyrophosphoryl-undecaprenol N-acetylglucosamine transferase
LNTNKHIKVIIAGGGTGGHIFPAVAIANAIKQAYSHADILFVGALGKMEMEKVPKEGYKIIGLPIAGFNRSNMFKNITLPFKLLKSFLMARTIIKQHQPHIIIGVGGFASHPVMYMGQLMGIATVIQEQNSYAGKANKQLAVKANKIFVAYEGMQQFFPANKILLTGNPVRASIAQSTVTKQQGITHFNLSNTHTTILIIGGSLGAKSINDAVANGLSTLMQQPVQLLWQTGKQSYATIQPLASEHVHVYEFIYEMHKAYAAADIIISRSGALSIAELCIVGKPVIFVPYPHAAEDHQTSNAMALVNKKAGLIIPDNKVQHDLLPLVLSLLNNTQLCIELGANCKQMAITNAAERIVQQIDNLLFTQKSIEA